MSCSLLSGNRKDSIALLTVMAVVCIALGSASSCELYESASSVVCLTPTNFFDTVLSSTDLWFVAFYAPWSGHCKQLAPAFKAAAKFFEDHRRKLNNSDVSLPIRFGVVNGYAHEELRSRFNPPGYPTVFIFGANKTSPTRYEGPRTRRNLVEAAVKECQSQQAHLLPEKLSDLATLSARHQLDSFSDGLFDPSDIVEIFDDVQFRSVGLVSHCPDPPSSSSPPAEKAERVTQDQHQEESSFIPLVLAVYRFARGNQTENREFAVAFNSLVSKQRGLTGRRLFAAVDLDETWGFDAVKGLNVKFPSWGHPPPLVLELQVRLSDGCFTSPQVYDSWRNFIRTRGE